MAGKYAAGQELLGALDRRETGHPSTGRGGHGRGDQGAEAAHRGRWPSSSSPCSARPCWPIRCWISTSCCWSGASANNLGLPQNWQGNCALGRDRLRQRDRRALAGPARGQADHAASSPRRRSSSATWTCTSTPTGCCSRCPARTAAGRSGRSRPTAAACARSRPATSPTSTTTTPATCPTAGSSSPRPLLPRRALRGRRQHGGQPVPHERRRHGHPPAVLRPGPQLVPDGAERRPRAVHALGILRHAALLHAASCST